MAVDPEESNVIGGGSTNDKLSVKDGEQSRGMPCKVIESFA